MNQQDQLQKTFAMIKPHAVSKNYVTDIIKEISESGKFTIVKSKYLRFTTESSTYFYEEHKDKEFFPKL